jgi:hypothetical protein
MKPERIEELARLAYEAAQDSELGAVPDYDELAEREQAAWSRLFRTLYAAAMRDAAGVAREAYYQACCGESYECCGSTIQVGLSPHEIATALETIAKETDSAGN